MSNPEMSPPEGEEQKRPPHGRRNRRVTAPATSGQSEAVESQVYDPLSAERTGAENEGQQRTDWLKSQRPPHWEG